MVRSLTSIPFVILIASTWWPCLRAMGAQHVVCHEGQYMSSTNKCRPCPSGHFMSESAHTNKKCAPCSPPPTEGLGLYELSKCNATQDSVRSCAHGFFVDMWHRGRCLRCTDCELTGTHTARRCTTSTDTQCCPSPTMEVRNLNAEVDSSHCVHMNQSRTYCCCKRGHYLRLELGDVQCIPGKQFLFLQKRVSEQSCGINQYLQPMTKKCLLCPLCSYQNKTEHQEEKCLPCSMNNPKLAYCPRTCQDREANTVIRLFFSGIVVVTFPLVLVPLSLAIVNVAKQQNWI